MEELLLAIDVGTSSVKVVVFDREGGVVQAAMRGYPTLHPVSHWVEQNPDSWWEAVVQCLHLLWQRGVEPRRIMGIGLSGQMEICLPLDRDGRVLYPAILYSDMRTGEEVSFIRERIGEKAFWEMTGNALAPSMTLTKLLWLKKEKPELYQVMHMVVTGAKDYILYRLTGVHATDPTNASTTGMLEMKKRSWSLSLLQELGLSPSYLPLILLPHEKVGVISDHVARRTGLLAGCPVFCGAGDAGTSSLGAGVIHEDRAHVYLGTTGWVATVGEVPPAEHQEGLFLLCDVDPRYYLFIAPLLNAGRAYHWVMELFGYEEENGYLQVEREMEKVPPGSRGVIFLPYLRGERSPFHDPRARGVFFGLSEETSRGDLLRATLEGVSFGIRQALDLLKRQRGEKKVNRLTLIGGGSRSSVWGEILAHVCRCEIVVPKNSAYASSWGATLLTMRGLGFLQDYSEGGRFLKEGRVYEVNLEVASLYERVFALYEKLYPLLRPLFEEREELHSL